MLLFGLETINRTQNQLLIKPNESTENNTLLSFRLFKCKNMKVTYTYFKNSNTGELIFRQVFSETEITGIPDYFYDKNRKSIDKQDLNGFIEISEKKFNRESKRSNQDEQ